jgi:hypothetical protein
VRRPVEERRTVDVRVREADPDDLESIAALTRTHRHRLAAWGPHWWRVAEGADAIHPLWLGHLISSDLATVRVLVAGEEIIGTAVAVAQPNGWFVDDVAIADDSLWPVVAPALARGIDERPALTCVATADRPRADALDAEGIRLVSSYWIRATEPGPTTAAAFTASHLERVAPPHSFGVAFDPAAEGALAFTIGSGVVVGSPSTAAPPVYDPGGTVTVVDQMRGDDLDALAAAALAVASARGDVLLAVVCGTEDTDLAIALAGRGFDRTVDVHRWPSDV